MQPDEFRNALKRLCGDAGRNMHWVQIVALLEAQVRAEREEARKNSS